MEDIAQKLNISIEELEDGIKQNLIYYGVEDFDEKEQLPLFILARVRDLNSDEFNMYKIGSYYSIVYKDKQESILFDESFYDNLFKFLDNEKLNYKLK